MFWPEEEVVVLVTLVDVQEVWVGFDYNSITDIVHNFNYVN